MGDQKLREWQMEKRLNIYTTIGRCNKTPPIRNIDLRSEGE